MAFKLWLYTYYRKSTNVTAGKTHIKSLQADIFIRTNELHTQFIFKSKDQNGWFHDWQWLRIAVRELKGFWYWQYLMLISSNAFFFKLRYLSIVGGCYVAIYLSCMNFG